MLETSIVLTCFDPRNTYVLLKVQGSVKMILLKTVFKKWLDFRCCADKLTETTVY